jgi:hypothetical protein
VKRIKCTLHRPPVLMRQSSHLTKNRRYRAPVIIAGFQTLEQIEEISIERRGMSTFVGIADAAACPSPEHDGGRRTLARRLHRSVHYKIYRRRLHDLLRSETGPARPSAPPDPNHQPHSGHRGVFLGSAVPLILPKAVAALGFVTGCSWPWAAGCRLLNSIFIAEESRKSLKSHRLLVS